MKDSTLAILGIGFLIYLGDLRLAALDAGRLREREALAPVVPVEPPREGFTLFDLASRGQT